MTRGQGPRFPMRGYCQDYLTASQARLLAVLLDADGGPVQAPALMRIAVGQRWMLAGMRTPSGDGEALLSMARRLERAGVDCLLVEGPIHRRTARLTALPPDWALDQIIATLDGLRRASDLPTSRNLRTA